MQVTKLSTDTLWDLLDYHADELSEQDTVDIENEIDRREYDDSDPASPQNTATDARDTYPRSV